VSRKKDIKKAFEDALLSALKPTDEDGAAVPVDPRVLTVARQYVSDLQDELPEKSEIEKIMAENEAKLPFRVTTVA
jgi:hypothetical protein